MSMFDIVFGGPSPFTPVVAILLGQQDLCWYGRLRSAWIEQDENGNPRLAVYTRNGGPNSEHNENIRKHPLYITDKDDSFDNTYNTSYFKLPENASEILWEHGCPRNITVEMMTHQGPISMSQEWQKAIDMLKNGELGENNM